MKKFLSTATVCALAFAAPAKADLFSITLTQGANTNTVTYNSVMDIFDAYQDGKLDTILSGYNKNAGASGYLNFRGIDIYLEYKSISTSNNTLTLKIPSLGIDGSTNSKYLFGGDGKTQETAFDAFKDFLKTNQADLLTDLLKESVSKTPYDSVAGNPSSLMAQMTNLAFENPTLTTTDRAVNSKQSGGFIVLSPSAGTHKITGKDGVERTATTFNLPLGYTFKFDNDWALGIDLPLSYIDIDGSITYAAQVGVSLQMAVPGVKDWLITFSGRVGATASEDSLSGGVLYMASATSSYTFNLGESNTSVTILNMFGHIQDYTLDVKGYNIEYGLKNDVFKNGLAIKQFLSTKTAVTVFGYDTRYTGSDLYIDAYDEVGFSLTKYFSGNSFFTGIDLTASYAFGDHYKAYRAGINFLF